MTPTRTNRLELDFNGGPVTVFLTGDTAGAFTLRDADGYNLGYGEWTGREIAFCSAVGSAAAYAALTVAMTAAGFGA